MQGIQFAAPNQISLGAAPKEGPMAVTQFVDFSQTAIYNYDLTGLQIGSSRISMVQTVFADNSQSNMPLVITVGTTQQQIIFPPGAQGYLPLFVTNGLKFTVASQTALIIPIIFTNVAMNPGIWFPNVSAQKFDGSGNLLVSDAILDGAVQSGNMQTQINPLASTGAIMPDVRATSFVAGTLATFSNGLNSVTPITGTPGFRLKNVRLWGTPDLTLAAGAAVTFTISEVEAGGTEHIIDSAVAFIGTTAPTVNTPPLEFLKYDNLEFTSKFPTSHIAVKVSSAAPATGSYRYSIGYALSSFVGG